MRTAALLLVGVLLGALGMAWWRSDARGPDGAREPSGVREPMPGSPELRGPDRLPATPGRPSATPPPLAPAPDPMRGTDSGPRGNASVETENDLAPAEAARGEPAASLAVPEPFEPARAKAAALLMSWLPFDTSVEGQRFQAAQEAAETAKADWLRARSRLADRFLALEREKRDRVAAARTELGDGTEALVKRVQQIYREFADALFDELVHQAPQEQVARWRKTLGIDAGP